jgi:hypothetical protein
MTMKMYYRIILLLTISISTFHATAQLHGSVRAGLNRSTFRLSIDDSDTSNPIKFNYRWGAAIGGYAQIGMGRLFSLQPELQYTRLGGQIYNDYNKNDIEYLTLRHNWLQVLLLARMDFSYKQYRIHILAGPHFGYSIGQVYGEIEHVYTDGDEIMREVWSGKAPWDNLKGSSFRRYEPGITAGLGVDFPAGPGRLGFDFRFQRGFSSWINPEWMLAYFSNMNLQLGCSYTLLLRAARE